MPFSYKNFSFIASSIFVLIFVMPLFVFDNVLVWDDWVWINSESSQLREVAIQLGLWWLAEINVNIYKLENPNILLFFISFFSNLISVYLISKIFDRYKIFNDIQSAYWIALCIISPLLIIRYINSVSFYNLYVLSFVCGAYIHIFYKNLLIRSLGLLFILFSFSLASLIPVYYFLIVVSDDDLCNKYKLVFQRPNNWKNIKSLINKQLINKFITRSWPYLLLPFIFLVIKQLNPYYVDNSNPYKNYNQPDFANILKTPFETILSELRVIADFLFRIYFHAEDFGVLLGLIITFVCTLIAYVVISKFVKRNSIYIDSLNNCSGWHAFFWLLALLFMSIFPYLFVGKHPKAFDFIESRHLIPSQPIIYAIIVIICFQFSKFIGKYIFNPFTVFNAFMIWMIANSIGIVLYSASNLWWENRINNFIIESLKTNKSDLNLWLFDDRQLPSITKRWNYVYTGYLISAFGRQYDKLGISNNEYSGWTIPVMLLSDNYFKERYNIKNYIHRDSYNQVVLKEKIKPNSTTILGYYIKHLFGINVRPIENYYQFSVSKVYGCVDEMVQILYNIPSKNIEVNEAERNYCENYTRRLLCNNKFNASQYFNLGSPEEKSYIAQKYYDISNLTSEINNNTELYKEYESNITPDLCRSYGYASP